MDQTETGGTVRGGGHAESSAAVELSDFAPCSSDGLDGERMGFAKPDSLCGGGVQMEVSLSLRCIVFLKIFYVVFL